MAGALAAATGDTGAGREDRSHPPTRGRATSRGPLDAPTKTASPAIATACRYDACRPLVVHDQEEPASRLHPNPRCAATATTPVPVATTWWTSVLGSRDGFHVSPSSSDRQTPPT